MSCDPNQLETAAKGFAGIEAGRISQVITYLLCQIAQQGNPAMNCDPNVLQAAAACFCFDSLTNSRIQTYLLCQILANGGGGGGGSCLLCGVVDPNISGLVPECDCAIYYNKLTREFWDWDGVSWQPFIAQP